ncbi:MAG: glycosyltransferase family 4 protein [bacterium]|nr:glycosyltransferase family 4 protein [bacterium]
MMIHKKEHVLLITTDFVPQKGGIARWAYEEYRELAKRYDVTIIDKFKKEIVPNSDTRYFRDKEDLKQMVSTLNKSAPFQRILFFHWEPALFLLPFLRSAKISFTVVLHGWEFLRPRSLWTRYWKRQVLLRCNEIWITSPYMKKKVLACRIGPEKIKLKPIPIDREIFHPWTDTEVARSRKEHGISGKKVILSVGRLVERKDYITILKSVVLLRTRYPEVLYVLIGDGPYRGMIESFITENHLEENVLLPGEVEEKVLLEWYCISHVFVLVPRDLEKQGDVEGFGIVYHEASSCGLPVIGSRAGGVPYALSLIPNSYLIEPGDFPALAGLIENLILRKDTSSGPK